MATLESSSVVANRLSTRVYDPFKWVATETCRRMVCKRRPRVTKDVSTTN